MKRDYDELLKKHREIIESLNISEDEQQDIYSAISIVHLMGDKSVNEAMEHIKRTALYMDLPHPLDRDVRGENDFAAIRLCVALYELYDKLTEETKTLVKRFFLERDFTSMYGSENHVFMMRAARYLAAQFYKEDFKQFNMTAEEVLKTDKKYITEFIQFRAKYGIGEFTSAYLYEDMFMCAMLQHYAEDGEVKNIAQMALDLLFIEALNNLDEHGYFAGGAGRTYSFNEVGCHSTEGIKKVFVDMVPRKHTIHALVKHSPDKFIADAFCNRKYPCEVFEQKHLHSMYAWRTDTPDWAHIEKLHKAGCISKYTYLSKEYGIGAINHQDDYPVDETEDFVYAHHQQVEWSLVIPGKDMADSTKIFSHHPGLTDQHRHWTGDLDCCCSKAYANKNTLLTIYDIEKEDKLGYTHMFLELEKFDRVEKMENDLFLRKGNVNVFVHVANPYTIDIKESELISQGRKNAYVCRVEVGGDFDKFIEKYRNMPVKFDKSAMRLEFDGLFIDKSANGSIASPEKYPYTHVYKSEWVEAKWGEGIVYVHDGDKTLVMDFNENRKYIK